MKGKGKVGKILKSRSLNFVKLMQLIKHFNVMTSFKMITTLFLNGL